ncbi:MAG: rhomboid family intramembrane serine protease [Pseudomonadota bacterium]
MILRRYAKRIPVTALLLVTNVALFGLGLLPGLRRLLLEHFMLFPPQTRAFESWQYFTHAFLHADETHLFLNMLGLLIFGRVVEWALGSGRFAVLYVVAVFGAAFTQTYLNQLLGFPVRPMLGASGGVYGVVLCYAMLFPKRKIVILPLPIPMSAPLVAAGMAAIALFLGLTQPNGGVAHFAHLGGMLFALPLVLFWRDAGRVRRVR